ncbi:MAG: hypothetical protein IJ494_07970 [Bacteroides sp.]|nr:hypothetical protein [Bacteroides sp.]
MKKTSLWVVILTLILPATVHAQYLRNSYFMEGSSTRMQLNPALQPRRGYINLPVIGSLNAEVSTNSLGSQDVIDMFDEDGEYYKSTEFINKLKDNNQLNVSLNTDVISFGFHKGKGFWSFNVGARVDVDAEIPKTMFEFMRAADTFGEDFEPGYNEKYTVANENLRLNAYTEVGLGYSRIINDRLTIGAKAKLLLGWANLDLKVNKLHIDAYVPNDVIADYAEAKADIETDVEMKLSGKGISLSEDEDGVIDDVEFDKFGIGGYGGAIDLGFSYAVTKHFNISASVLDLGFIKWGKENTITAKNDQEVHVDYLSDVEVLDFDLYELQQGEESKARTTKLSPMLVVGGEYNLLNNKIGFGLLSTTRFGQLKTYSELTASATFRPNTLINATVSYSMLQGSDTFGVALKLGPLMLGTDYMYLGNNTKHVNAFVGLSIPLGKKKNS